MIKASGFNIRQDAGHVSGTVIDTSKRMKLRLRNNSIRLRLTQSDVEQFTTKGTVEDKIEFGIGSGQSLVFRMKRDDSAELINAKISSNELTIVVPGAAADEWSQSEQVRMEVNQDIGNGRGLNVLIEKDFACLNPRAGGDDRDTFPHPLAGRIC